MDGRRRATDQEAKALASSLRLRILRICLDEAHTNKEIADTLGRDPASVLHHVRTLVRSGFLEPQAARHLLGGGREIPYLATKKSWQINLPRQGRAMLDTLLEEVTLVPEDEIDTARVGMRLTSADRSELGDRLRGLLDEFANRPVDPAAEAWSVFVTVYPDPNRR